jgi:hypothetical protein
VNRPTQAERRLAAVVVGGVSAYDVLFVATSLSGLFVLGYKFDLLLPDFMVFHAAARAFFDGRLDLLYDVNAFTSLQNVLYAGRAPFELAFRPFLYPPLWLFDLLPVGLMPLIPAAAVFLLFTAAVAILGLRATGLGPWPILFILTAPAANWVVIAGQNTFLSVGLLYGGLALLERRPVLAGVLLGLLAYKPQVWVLVPLALLASRAWLALAATVATVVVQSLAALLLFGLSCWLDFLAAARWAGSEAAAAEMFERVHAHMTTLLAAAKILGLGNGPAMALQMGGAALAVAAVAWAFARHPASHARTAVLVTATFLVSPYTLNYDMLLLMPAAALLFLQPAPTGYLPGELAVYPALWLVPHFCMVLNAVGVPLTPLIILLFGVVAWRRLAAKVELPAAAGAR